MPALLIPPVIGDSERLGAWAARTGTEARTVGPAGAVVAVVEAFAAGHASVLVLTASLPDAFLDLALTELAEPMTAVLATGSDGRLVLVGLNEVVPALLRARLAGAEALQVASDAGLSPVVLPPVW